MGELIILESMTKSGLLRADKFKLDLTPEAQKAGIPASMQMTWSVYNLLVQVTSANGRSALIDVRKREIVDGLVKMMCRRGLRMNGHLCFKTMRQDEEGIDLPWLAAWLHNDDYGRHCITVGLPQSIK